MSENKSFFDDLEGKKPESFEEEVFVKRKRGIVPVIAAAIVAAAVIVAAVLLINQSKVAMPDMVGWNVQDAATWANENDINLVYERVFSLDVDSDVIMSQTVAPEELLKKKSSIEIAVSQGADPEGVIELPDLRNMNRGEIDQWVAEYALTGISYKTQESDSYEKGDVISFRMIDGTQEYFLRKHRIEITVSDGPAVVEESLNMPDLYGKTKDEVVAWAVAEQVTVEFEEVFDEVLDYHKVLAQSITKNSRFSRDEIVVVTLSLGEAILVPDFVGLKNEEASSLASLNDIQILTLSVPSDEEGVILSQDMEAGSQMYKEQYITLYVGEKSDDVIMPDLVGKTISQAETLAGIYSITIIKEYVISSETGDVVLSQSQPAGTLIHADDYVTLVVSEGYVSIPNLVGMTKNEADIWAQQNNITLIYNEVTTVDANNNVITAQHTAVDELLKPESSIIVELAVNSGVYIDDIEGMTRDEATAYMAELGVSLTLIENYHDVYEKGRIYSPSHRWEILPKDATVVAYCSLGDVMIGDYVGSKEIEVHKWAEEINSNGGDVKVQIVYVYTPNHEEGDILEQSVRNSTLPLDGSISVRVATESNDIWAPSVKNEPEYYFIDWCNTNNIPFLVLYKYNDVVPEGRICYQSLLHEPIPAGEVFIVHVSLGELYMKNFIGLTIDEVNQFKSEIAQLYGNFDIEIEYEVNPEATPGVIIGQSIVNEYVKSGTVITFTLAQPEE